MKRNLFVFIGIVIVASAALLIFGFEETSGSSNSVKKLPDAEVKEYEGKNLSSINDFRENSIKGPQYVDEKSYTLSVTGIVKTPKNYTYQDVLKNQAYRKVVKLRCVEGWSVEILWEGILISDLIENSEILETATTVIFHSVDGYATSIPLKYVIDRKILLAYKMNGVVLPPERGFPFQVVAEDKWGYKWAKWVNEIELSDNYAYRGTWESAGFSNDGDLSGSKYEEKMSKTERNAPDSAGRIK